jgi:NitT/TauT family transport system substrate-binding protein
MAASAAGTGIALPAFAQNALVEVVFGILSATSAEWPEYMAEAQGYFKDEGIKLTIVASGSPPSVIQALATGAVNLGTNGTDSVVAAISRGLPIKMIASGFGPNPYSLVVSPQIKSWADLKGKSVVLGTKQDVTALAFESLANQQKLTMDDFSIVVGGNTPARYAALQSGNVAGAMLTQPFDFEAESNGMRILASASDVIKDWQFTVIAANTDWATKNRALTVKYLRAMRRAIQYGYGNKDGAVKAMMAATKASQAIVSRAYDTDFGKWKAFSPTLAPSQAGVEAVMRSQVAFGALKVAPKFSDVFDPSFITEAAH